MPAPIPSCKHSESFKARRKKKLQKRTIKDSSEPIVKPLVGDEICFKRFFGAFISTFAALFILLGLFSYVSNFWGFFGSSGAWALFNDRQAKVDYLRKIERPDLPEAYILGSSDMFPFQPRQITEKTGFKAFNLANYWGRMEEIWGWLNFLISDLNTPPKLLIVGLEPWTFSADESGPAFMKNYRRRFIATPDLVKYAPDFVPWKWQLAKLTDLFSVNNIWYGVLQARSGTLLKMRERPTIEQSDVLAIDGTNVGYNKPRPEEFFPSEYNDFYRDYVSGVITDPVKIESKRAEILSKKLIRKDTILRRLPNDVLDREDLRLFSKFVQLCEDYDVQLVLILPPLHPIHADYLRADTSYSNHLARIIEMITKLKRSHQNIRVIFDATDLKTFGGDPREFHDINHMTPVNAQLIMQKALEQF